VRLQDLGWDEYVQTLQGVSLDTAFVARITSENKTNYTMMTENGERSGVLRGKTHYSLGTDTQPKVGDWVVFSNEEEGSLVAIEKILPRCAKLSRHAAGHVEEEQVMVANIDTVFIMQGLDGNFNANRIERYLVMVENSGAKPVIVLNKIDLVEDPTEYEDIVRKIAPHVPIIMLSAQDGAGIDMFKEFLTLHSTSVFVGSSGVGKSTLLNVLLGQEVQETQGLRDDDQGRHTTTRRELFVLPNGAIIIDTPGMREVSIKGMDSIEETFEDVETLATQCKYRKCDHVATEGCALRQAVEDGEIDQAHVENFLKLMREQDFERGKVDKEYGYERKARIKKTQKGYKKILEEKYRGREWK
jgi:ribosome biogenesis GTPase